MSPSVALRVFIVFSLGYFVSYLFRGVNIGFAPYLSAEMGLSASDLGTLTGMYFLAFSVVQIPAGILIDTYGPRRVNACMMVVAAIGTVVFGLSQSLAGLMLGRILVGVGVAICLGAALKAMAQVFPLARLPFINGLVMAVGGMGGVAVGTPLSWLLDVADWRMISHGMAVLTLAVAAAIWFGARAPVKVSAHRTTIRQQLAGTVQILADRRFWQMVTFPVFTGAMFYAVQSLWVGPFLRDVYDQPADSAARLVSILGLAMVAGNIALGGMARRVERAGISLYAFTGLCMLAYVVVQVLLLLKAPMPAALLWAAYGVFGSSPILGYAVMAERYPYSMLGRVGTTVTLLTFLLIFVCQAGIGWAISLWPQLPGGGYPAIAHITAWSVVLVLQVLGAIWYFWPVREQAA